MQKNYDFLIPISLQHVGLNFWYFKLFEQTEFLVRHVRQSEFINYSSKTKEKEDNFYTYSCASRKFSCPERAGINKYFCTVSFVVKKLKYLTPKLNSRIVFQSNSSLIMFKVKEKTERRICEIKELAESRFKDLRNDSLHK